MVIKNLTDICNPKQWKTIQNTQLKTLGYPVYGANGIIGYYDTYNHESDTLIIGCRGTCGAITIAQGKTYINGNAMCLDKLSNEIELKYLYYFLKSFDFKNIISGTTIPQITIEGLKKIKVPIPKKEKQLEIIKILDKAEKILEIEKNKLNLLDELIKARFVELFVNKDFPKTTIGEIVASKVSSVKKDFLPKDTIKYIDISSIDNKRNIMTGFTEYVLEDAPSRAQQHIRKGDIIVSTVRPNLKNVAITGYDYDNLVASSGFCVLRTEKCLPSYLMAVVCSDDFTDTMTKVVTGANYPAIKDSDVKNYVVPNPPVELQEQFATFVEQTDKSKSVCLEKIEKYTELYNKLMNDYFGG